MEQYCGAWQTPVSLAPFICHLESVPLLFQTYPNVFPMQTVEFQNFERIFERSNFESAVSADSNRKKSNQVVIHSKIEGICLLVPRERLLSSVMKTLKRGLKNKKISERVHLSP
jgi:hypothetical protein